MNDLTATSTITVSKPVKITSDKNVTITRGNSSGNTSFTDVFFKVETSGSLELEGKENSTITLDGGNINETPILATAPLITSSGNLTLTNCILQNNKNTSDTPGGAINISAGTFTMNGGVIGEVITETDLSKIYSWQYAATDSKFSNYAYAGGGGIYVEDGTVTINGGKISYNYTRNPESDCGGNTPENTAHGGGISIVKGSLSLTNSEVSYNSGYQGGGIRCYNENTYNAGTLTLNKTLIKGNTSNPYSGSSFGGGLMVNNFNVTFAETTESTIEQNYSGDGGALFLENTTSTLKNITIQNNSYNPSGYHYGSELLLWANANVSIDDSNVNIASTEAETRGIFINNNANMLKLFGDAKLDAPVYLMSGTTVTVAGYLSSNTPPVATITPEKYEEGTQVLTADDTTLLEQSVGKFALTPSTDGTDYKIDADGKLAKINTELNLVTELSNINVNGFEVKQLPSGVYYLESNLVLDYPVYISDGDVVIYAKENAIITGSSISTDSFFSVSDGYSLTFGKDESTDDAILTINAENKSGTYAVLNALSSGTLNLKNNVICTGATKQSFITTANGTVNISGGKITENHGESPVINVTGGTVNITGGEISNNSCVDMYGNCSGILVSRGTLNIDGSTITISNNTYGISSDDLENQGASIYNEGGAVTILGTTLDQKAKFTQNIVNGKREDVPSGGGNGTVTGITYAGTDSDSSLPKFLISSPEGLSTFRDMVNGLVLSDITISSDGSLPDQQNYSVLKKTPLTEIVGQLTSDIDLELYENWTPIGTNDNPFAGSFYGENYTVSNLNINATTDNQGLFGVVEGSSNRICNISKLNVEGTIISSNCNVGGIAGNATYTKFESCVNKASVESTSSDTNVCVAGIVGYISNVEIENCYNSGNITANGAVAGIVGFESGSTISNPTFDYCINTGTITGGSYYGGIIGYAEKALSVGYCANYGKIISTSNSDTGCLIGECSSSNKPQVTECLIVGKIETSGKYYAVSCNASVTSSIYDSNVLSDVTKNSSGGETGMATEELKAGTELEQFFSGYWYYSKNSYPIPDLEGCVSDEIWEEIKQEISSL